MPGIQNEGDRRVALVALVAVLIVVNNSGVFPRQSTAGSVAVADPNAQPRGAGRLRKPTGRSLNPQPSREPGRG